MIKKFENFQEKKEILYRLLPIESNGNKGDGNWEHHLNYKSVCFAQFEIDFLIKTFSKYIISDNIKKDGLRSCCSFYLNNNFIIIDKYEDDWFMVSDYPHYYSCDSIEGVVQYLKTII